MKKRQDTVIYMAILIVVLLAVTAWALSAFGSKGEPTILNTLALQIMPGKWTTYVNAQGKAWQVPKGSEEFQVSSRPDNYPRFLSGKVDPVDARPGSTQTMTVVVLSIGQPQSVVATVQHDNGEDTVPLQLMGTKAMAENELQNREILVDQKGVVVINNGATLPATKSEIASVIASLISSANAEGAMEYTYEGSWTVHDTHQTTYRTSFVATDNQNRQDAWSIPWSDPTCSYNSSGQLLASCTVSTGGYGYDGNSTLSNVSINLSGTAILAKSPGTAMTLGASAQVGIAGSGAMQENYVCYTDADGDKYTPSANVVPQSSSCGSGYVSGANVLPNQANVTSAAPTLDCKDSDGNVFPGQTAWFTSSSGGSWDYNCSGVVQYYDPYYITDWAGQQTYNGGTLIQKVHLYDASAGGAEITTYGSADYCGYYTSGQLFCPTINGTVVDHINNNVVYASAMVLPCGATDPGTKIQTVYCGWPNGGGPSSNNSCAFQASLAAGGYGRPGAPNNTPFTQSCR